MATIRGVPDNFITNYKFNCKITNYKFVSLSQVLIFSDEYFCVHLYQTEGCYLSVGWVT